MNAFVFGDNTIEININGTSFVQDPAVVEVGIAAAQKVINDFNAKMTAGEADSELLYEAKEKIAGHIESVLCKGAVDTIFAGRDRITLHELIDVVVYVRAATREFEAKRAELYKGYTQLSAAGEE